MMIEVLERLNNYDMYYRPFSDDDTSPELQLERIPLMSVKYLFVDFNDFSRWMNYDFNRKNGSPTFRLAMV